MLSGITHMGTPALQPVPSARQGHLASPATTDLGLRRESITAGSESITLSSTESRAPLGWPQGWGRAQPPCPGRGWQQRWGGCLWAQDLICSDSPFSHPLHFLLPWERSELLF